MLAVLQIWFIPSILASLSLELVTSRNYLSELGIKNGGTNGNNKSDETNLLPIQDSKGDSSSPTQGEFGPTA